MQWLSQIQERVFVLPEECFGCELGDMRRSYSKEAHRVCSAGVYSRWLELVHRAGPRYVPKVTFEISGNFSISNEGKTKTDFF